MSWTLTQNGSSFSGTLTLVEPSQSVSGRGTVSGTVSGSTLQFSLSVPAGGFDGAYAGCSTTAAGTGTVSGTAITGTYTGTTSCSSATAISSGQITLNKQ